MMRIAFPVLIAALVLAGAPAVAQEHPQPATITVNGSGTASRTPDQAVVRLDIQTNNDVAEQATSANNAAFAKLREALHGLGLADSAIHTTNLTLNYVPRPAHPPSPPLPFPPRYGYTVDRGVEVTSDRTDQAGPIIDAAVRSGVTSIGGVTFGVRDQRGAQRAALAAAVADAEAQARAIADAAHVRLGSIISIAAGGAVGPRPLQVLGRVAMAPAAVPTEIQPSDLTVAANVNVTYAIAP